MEMARAIERRSPESTPATRDSTSTAGSVPALPSLVATSDGEAVRRDADAPRERLAGHDRGSVEHVDLHGGARALPQLPAPVHEPTHQRDPLARGAGAVLRMVSHGEHGLRGCRDAVELVV